MKVLLDACVWGGAVGELERAGHDVVYAGDWAEDPGDEEILEWSHEAGRVLVTLDKDFGELAVLHGARHSGIVRLVGFTGPRQGATCVQVLERFASDLEAGALITAEPGRVRVRSV